MIRGISAIAFAVLFVGCRDSSDSMTSGLSGTLKPEGFLVIKDIAADPAKAGSFLVTCATSAGEKKSTVSQADVEANKVCLPAPAGGAPAASAGSQAGSQPNAGPAVQTPAGYQAKNLQSTYLKARPALDVTGNISNLKVGVDYCVISSTLSASSICNYSQKELKVTGVKLSGCDLTSGYIFAQHFSVTPSVSACR